MQVIYRWVFSVDPVLCPSLPPHSKSGGAHAPPKYMSPAPLLPGPIISKLGMIDYVGDPYWQTSFSGIWLGGEFPENKWNTTSLWLFVVSFFRLIA